MSEESGLTAKQKREQRRNIAKRKMYTFPLSLKWFKYFRYVIVGFSSIILAYDIINLAILLLKFTGSDDNAIVVGYQLQPFVEALDSFPLFLTICIEQIIVSVIMVTLAVITFFKMGELDKTAYTLVKIYIVFNTVSGSAFAVLNMMLSTMMSSAAFYENNSYFYMRDCIIQIISNIIWMILNLVYFKRRKELFISDVYVAEGDHGADIYDGDTCPYCGAVLDKNTEFCDKCGKNL